MFAAREGDLESAKLLLDAGADVNQTTEYGWTPLLTATNNRHYVLGKFLLERGADPNRANKGGWTPLYLATDNRNIEGGDYPVPKPDMDHLEYIKLLLEHGADPNARVKDNTLTRTIFTMQWFYEDGCDAVRARRAVERHRADAAAARLGRRSVHRRRPRRHGADGRRRHRVGGRRHVRAVAEGQPRGRARCCSTSASIANARQPRRPHAADGRGAQGPERRRAVARRSRRQASISATAAAATRTRRPRSWPATRGRRSTTPTAWCASACSRPSTRPETAALIRKMMTEREHGRSRRPTASSTRSAWCRSARSGSRR
mgnify:CR=1 FL=1